tara:strand:+ start:3151 stop:3633 length:483 start_codon:yes stop_codon:yes gene_type:complete
MKNIKNRVTSIFAAIGAIAIITAFTSQTEPVKVYEFETVTIVESLIQNGLGRSRMISKTEDVDYREATTIRKEDGKKEKSDKKRSEIRTYAFEETKLLNFYNVAGIRFNNIATNDAMVKSKLNEMSAQGWELVFVSSGVESADKERDAIFITRYHFRKEK